MRVSYIGKRQKTLKNLQVPSFCLTFRHFLGSCCRTVTVSGREDDFSIPDIYKLHSTYNGRPAYKSQTGTKYLFFVDNPSRWVVDNELGETNGNMSYDGIETCPENVVKRWLDVWNQNEVDRRISVQCSGSRYIDNSFGPLNPYFSTSNLFSWEQAL